MRSLRRFLPAVAPLWLCVAAVVFAADPEPRELFAEAVRLFFDAKPVESARVFDQLVAAVPAAEPELWQRGLALYYADRFDDGRKQFERHRTVNPADVENPAWHFLCVARLEGVKAAREKLLPVGADPRVPMREILDFYAGRGDAAAVLAAADKGPAEARRNQMCYAHLYPGPARTLGNLGWRGKPVFAMIGFVRSSPRSLRWRYSGGKGYQCRSGHGCQKHSGGVYRPAGSSIAHQPPAPSWGPGGHLHHGGHRRRGRAAGDRAVGEKQ